ncbi:fumarylacetoacetate hydrolase family protein [Bradyrhizobium sp. SYSU BS000235]|uniref:fumarylacetoacetate hydrolase family protein n=1 Tax=Bradyrhizobium sp. SYSU BS000235 TaxID=3411332 RepID=UPI003C768AD9
MMQLVTFDHDRSVKLGALISDGAVLDLKRAAADHGAIFEDLITLIQAGDAGINAVKRLLVQAQAGSFKEAIYRLSDVRLMAPIPRPQKNVFCVGRNYVEHVNEGYRARGTEAKLPEFPQFFTKPPTSVIAHGGLIPAHVGVTEKLDYEVELGLIIGTRGRDIPMDKAFDHIFGYTIINDVTGRDLQRRHDQWFKGKGLDGSCPIGPGVVLKSDIPDAQALNIELRVNGEVRQRSNTRHMIFSIPRIIANLSQGMTLEPGDIIATGTPSGVGYAMEPPHFLKSGDVVTCEIEGIGTLENRVA